MNCIKALPVLQAPVLPLYIYVYIYIDADQSSG